MAAFCGGVFDGGEVEKGIEEEDRGHANLAQMVFCCSKTKWSADDLLLLFIHVLLLG